MVHPAAWPGYNHLGNDRSGHMHLHPDGPYIRSDGRRGFFCLAPTVDGNCTDPSPDYLALLDKEHSHA